MFGRDGLSVSTRAIAQAAGVPLSAINYHFRGKDGLYLACAEHIAATMHTKTAPMLDRLQKISSSAQARARIELIVGELVRVMLAPEVAMIARFVVREQTSPTPAFDILYDGAIRHVIEPLIEALSLVGTARQTREQTRIRGFALVGQVFALSFGRATLMRLTDWKAVSETEIEIVQRIVLSNTRAVLASLERSTKS